MLEISVFILLALFMLGGSIAMIVNKQTVFSAFGFLITMIGLAGMFALLHNQFLAIAQILVSVGAVVVLSMLTILTVNAKEENLPREPRKYTWILIATVIVSPFTLLLYKTLSSLPQSFTQTETINSQVIGKLLFTDWVLPFEMLSILLLSAMLGAIVIGRNNYQRSKKSNKRRRV